MKKDLIINLTKVAREQKENTVIITEIIFPYIDRAGNVTVYLDNVTRKISNLLYVALMRNENITFVYRNIVMSTEEFFSHASYVIKNRQIEFELKELSEKTTKLIFENRIPSSIVKNIDIILDYAVLNQYGIVVGQQDLSYMKMTTYHPNDMQAWKWGISDKDFSFSKTTEQTKVQYTTTLYDKLVAWLQLTYFITNDFEPDFIPENEEPIPAYLL